MTLALEINDAGLVLARDGELVAEAPGYAMLDGALPETGVTAFRRARRKPLFAETRYWQELGIDPLPRPMPAARSYADVAFAQLAAFAAKLEGDDRRLLFAVPAWYVREQSSVLLGVAAEAGFEVVGLVDAGLAASALEPTPESVLQLELTLHRAVLTVLDHAGELRRTRYELLPQHGWLALQQAWLDMIAAAFVRKTRFDPLHEAESEQSLCDALPGWLDALASAPVVQLQMQSAGVRHAVELDRDDFARAAAPLYDGLVQLLQRARPAGSPLNLRLSHRFAGLPGFDDRLGQLRDCRVSRLPRGAAALGSLAYEHALQRPPGAVTLVQRLPVPLEVGVREALLAATAVPAAEQPTHVVHRSRGWPIGSDVLAIGGVAQPGRRAVVLGPGPGISRLHCTLVRSDDGVWLEDLSTYGTLVNGERVRGRVPVRSGDRLRIGSPGVECELVRVVDDDGTP